MSTTAGTLTPDPLSQSWTEWATELFEYEYCAECFGDADQHLEANAIGNWFAYCDSSVLFQVWPDLTPEELAESVRAQRGISA